MRYFLTGATGFVGGALARQLVAAGHEVIAVVREPSQARTLQEIGVAVHRGDVTDRESLRGPMTGADGVFHVAGWYKIGARDKNPAWPINVDGTRNVLQVMADLRIPKGVYTSTLAVFSDTHGRLVDETYRYDGPHLSEYDRTKWVAHYDVALPMMTAGLPLTIVQPGLIYGPGDTSGLRTTLIQFLRRRLPIVPTRTAFCWAHVSDVAHGHILAMEKGRTGETYIIAGPPHTLVEALGVAEDVTGIPGPRLTVPGVALKMLAVLMSGIERVVPLPERYTSEGLRTTAGVTYLGSNAKAARELGYAPRPLREGLSETLGHELTLLGARGAT